ncbi:uncharacterized protein LOC134170380 [Pezoporus occidentalis]|uniref:uncharacterized protein LOC134170380 n=1 Tax=Pezoporus occidentalis TaxID=407982 RepID=UPI002F911D04
MPGPPGSVALYWHRSGCSFANSAQDAITPATAPPRRGRVGGSGKQPRVTAGPGAGEGAPRAWPAEPVGGREPGTSSEDAAGQLPEAARALRVPAIRSAPAQRPPAGVRQKLPRCRAPLLQGGGGGGPRLRAKGGVRSEGGYLPADAGLNRAGSSEGRSVPAGAEVKRCGRRPSAARLSLWRRSELPAAVCEVTQNSLTMKKSLFSGDNLNIL